MTTPTDQTTAEMTAAELGALLRHPDPLVRSLADWTRQYRGLGWRPNVAANPAAAVTHERRLRARLAELAAYAADPDALPVRGLPRYVLRAEAEFRVASAAYSRATRADAIYATFQTDSRRGRAWRRLGEAARTMQAARDRCNAERVAQQRAVRDALATVGTATPADA